jgi:hypothetical protein
MPYIVLLLAMQLYAITRMVEARHGSLATPAVQVVAVQANPNPTVAVAR